jgi:hypothetical protein
LITQNGCRETRTAAGTVNSIFVERPENVRVEKGNLVIEARKERFTGAGQTRDFTSARIRTKHRVDWKYCRVEVRAKLPQGRGLWPAIWMLPVVEKYGAWAASGELDIVELIGHEPATVHGSLHYGGTWPKNTQIGQPFTLKNGTFADAFHTFAMEWEEGVIRWYVDGRALPDADEMEHARWTVSRAVRSAVLSFDESRRGRPMARATGCEDGFSTADARRLRSSVSAATVTRAKRIAPFTPLA